MSNFQFRIGETEDGKPVRMDLATLIETKLLDVANSGAGKSYLLRVLIERTAEKVQWIVIDPEGEYSTLREKFDFMLVGPDGELPVDVRSAGLLARKIMETRVSTIIDLYGLLEIRPQWAANFLNALMTLPKSFYTPVMVLIDEAHKFAPETPTGSKEEREHIQQSRRAVITLTDSGRKQSRGAAIATQRLSKLAADARGDLNNNFIGRMVQDLDRERAAEILGIRSRDSVQLRDLPPGTFFAFGPAFLTPGVLKVKIDQAITRHPKAGERHLLDVPKASDALKHLVEQMGDLPARAEEEAHTLETLQSENARLRRELAARPTQERVVVQEPRVEIQVVEKPVLNGQLPRLEAALDRMTTDFVQPLTVGLSNLIEPIMIELRSIHEAIERVQNTPAPVIAPRSMDFSKYANMTREQIAADTDVMAATKALRATTPSFNETSNEAMSGVFSPATSHITAYMRDLLKTFGKRHPLPLTKSQLALLAGKGKHSSALDSALAKIKRLGLVTSGNEMNLTESGFHALGADVPEQPHTFQDIVRLWREMLNEYERALFDPLLNAPHGLTLDELSERSGKSKTSSQFQSTVAMFVKNKIAMRRGERIVLHNPLAGR